MTDRKEELTKSFFDVYKDKGFKSISFDDLAHEFGISKKTIYKYFESKENVIECIVEYYIDLIKSEFKFDYLENAFDELVNFFLVLSKNPENIRPIFFHTLLKSHNSQNARLRQFTNEFFYGRLSKMLDQAKEEGYIIPKIDTHAFIQAHLNLIKTSLESKQNSEFIPNMKAEEYFSFVLYSLRGISTEKGVEYLDVKKIL